MRKWAGMASGTVFICYSTKDGADFTDRLVDGLGSGSPAIATFHDTDLVSGQHWDEQLARAIEKCSDLLFVVTKDSVLDDSVCKQEWMYARDKGKRIIPLLVDSAVPVPFGLQSLQRIDFSGDFETAMARLRADLSGTSRGRGPRGRRRRRRWPAIAGTAGLLGVLLLLLGIAVARLGIWPGQGAAATTPTPSPSASQPSLACAAIRPCHYQVELDGNPCLDLANGSLVDVRSCDGSSSAQRWIEDHDGRQFTLRNQATNRCVVAGAVGKPLAMGGCSDRAALWTSTINGDNSYTFHSVAQPSACIAGSGTEGTPVVLSPCAEAADQRWY